MANHSTDSAPKKRRSGFTTPMLVAFLATGIGGFFGLRLLLQTLLGYETRVSVSWGTDDFARLGGKVLASLPFVEAGATGDRVAISDVRVAPVAYAEAALGMGVRERLGVAGADASDAAGAAQPAPPRFLYDVPAGWKALPPRMFRDINLQHEEVASTQLTATAFNDRGGLRGNVDRWRREVGLAPLTDAEFEALPTRPVMGQPATYIELRGSYAGMGDVQLDDATVLGAIGKAEDLTLFVKMVVPTDMADEQRAVFDGFLDSLAINTEPAPPRADADPRAVGPAGATDSRSSPLRWDAPEGWAVEPPRNMFREVTFRSGGVEMYASLARGGVEGNVNRWAGQLGLEPLDDGALAALERVRTEGAGEAVVFEGTGSLQAMGSPMPVPGQRMLAAVAVPGDGRIVTLKMTGPDADVAARKDVFMSVLRSLALER